LQGLMQRHIAYSRALMTSMGPPALQPPPKPSPKTYYRKPLPSNLVAFSSHEGRSRFGRGLSTGNMECYFPLAEQFTTQNEPAFCGLGTLTCVLNALSIDPGRTWKGPWRWFADDMLDCCYSLEGIKMKGISLEGISCLARCNSASFALRRPAVPSPASEAAPTAPAVGGVFATLDDFRKDMMSSCRGDGSFLIVNYSRKSLGQSGDGHFSPVGGYDAESDSLLVLDVARFKYPPHWCAVSTMWEAMSQLTGDGVPRGWGIVSAAATPQAGGTSSMSTMRAITVCRDFPGWDQLLFILKEGGEGGFIFDECAACDPAAAEAEAMRAIARVTEGLYHARAVPVALAAFVQCCEVGGGGAGESGECNGDCAEAATFNQNSLAVKRALGSTKLYAAFVAAAGGLPMSDVGCKNENCKNTRCNTTASAEDEDAVLLTALMLAFHPVAPRHSTYGVSGCCGGSGGYKPAASGVAEDKAGGVAGGFARIVEALGEDVDAIMAGPAGREIEHVRAQLAEVMESSCV